LGNADPPENVPPHRRAAPGLPPPGGRAFFSIFRRPTHEE
jgi:hypothetical protein